MAYQIAYDLAGQMKRIPQWKMYLKYFGEVMLVIGVIGVILWTAGGDWAVTISALEAMAENLGQGSGLQEAFSRFCMAVLLGAQYG